jgi:hypothetical protein
MKSDRMAAYEAPRPAEPVRRTQDVVLCYKGRGIRVTVQIPTGVNTDLISYHGRTFIRRAGYFAEASVWPILEELDG